MRGGKEHRVTVFVLKAVQAIWHHLKKVSSLKVTISDIKVT